LGVDPLKVGGIAADDGCTVPSSEERNAGVHHVSATTFAAQYAHRLRFLLIEGLHGNQSRPKQAS
jgi:hypothetical protein